MTTELEDSLARALQYVVERVALDDVDDILKVCNEAIARVDSQKSATKGVTDEWRMVRAGQARGLAQVPDVERMDYLERCVMQDGGTFSADRDRDPHTDSPTFGDLPTVTLFTVPSQHVKGVGLRGAIDAAMLAAARDAKGDV